MVLQDWNGDPCLPFAYNWEWVACSFDERPRITALFLYRRFLCNAPPSCRNLANNNFSGLVPSSLTQKTNFSLETSGNLNLCSPGPRCDGSAEGRRGSDSSSPRGKGLKGKGLVFLVVVLVFLLALHFGVAVPIVIGLIWLFNRKKNQKVRNIRIYVK
ncbi:hypothetical protein GW17_00000341 [Ensete ventricosum]|nr:hypothetical protein GW17_00000341 [Ensete ventricosum]